MKCWLSLGPGSIPARRSLVLNLAHTFPHFLLTFVLPDKKKAISLDPNLTRYATERTFSIYTSHV